MITVDQVGVSANGVTLLAPVSVNISAGDALVVRGKNGTGKSTLLRVLAGSQQPSSGTAQIAGAAINERDAGFRRRVASMIGLPPTTPELTVADHVSLVASTWYDGSGRAAAEAASVLDELGISHLARRFPHELSSGQTQLFGLAMVLVRPSEVLILDEPEQRLDPDRLALVAQALNRRRDAGTSVVVATHSPVLAETLIGSTLTLQQAA